MVDRAEGHLRRLVQWPDAGLNESKVGSFLRWFEGESRKLATSVFQLTHGDLHAGNLLIDSGGTLRLVDFGDSQYFYFEADLTDPKSVAKLAEAVPKLDVLVHAAGNSTLWVGLINAYAAHLHALPGVVWLFRAGLLALLALHIWQGVALTLENRAAKGGGYAVTRYQRATPASRTMIWTGLVIAGFLLYQWRRIPKEGDWLVYDRPGPDHSFRFTVTKMTGPKIERVHVERV